MANLSGGCFFMALTKPALFVPSSETNPTNFSGSKCCCLDTILLRADSKS
jgi:hypothetical protein